MLLLLLLLSSLSSSSFWPERSQSSRRMPTVASQRVWGAYETVRENDFFEVKQKNTLCP